MAESAILTIAGIIITVLQTVIIFILTNMKTDIADIWKRVDNHYHVVECSNADCRGLKTGNVIIPGGAE